MCMLQRKVHGYIECIAVLLMQELGIKAHNGRNFKYSPAGSAVGNVSDNLLRRQFNAKGPNQKWVTDITYINANSK